MSLVIFDLDDTLVDRTRFFGEWAEEFVRQRRLDRGTTLAVLHEADGDGAAPRRLFFERVRAHFGLEESADGLIDDYWRDQMLRYRCEPETIDGLRRLRKSGYRLGIATNGGSVQLDKVRACGLDELVDATCASQMVGFAKPDSRLFEAVAERCGSSLADAWVVGDRPEADIAGAAGIGARSIWMRRGRCWAEQAFAPTLVAESVAEAMTLILTADGAVTAAS